MPSNTKQNSTFIKVEATKPRKEPTAALKAPFGFVELYISSPTKAPKKGPITKPKGGKNKPIINPILVPQIPYFVPPKCLVPFEGKT